MTTDNDNYTLPNDCLPGNHNPTDDDGYGYSLPNERSLSAINGIQTIYNCNQQISCFREDINSANTASNAECGNCQHSRYVSGCLYNVVLTYRCTANKTQK